ncbi:NAD(P)-binding protein [Aspergillus steynii IBT 23096]|uniref:NAD(P)-binding protein n=1 Tax=Aspergillus steynii IBT 23096 TaxID=1392250 RepID=A0A2I2GAY9_9EURO|nr:NAD(P)-binding protein [Aspergillus steynii IBT 23096]PLB50036.1 NAD(P)-binding protein [Aspergillus steynii IBT 23096]
MTKVALLGATGQIGQAILRALASAKSHEIVQLVHPHSVEKAKAVVKELEAGDRVTTVTVDVCECSVDELQPVLSGVEVIVSALNGKALEAQEKVQDAGARAGVRKIYPSEYGIHHIYHSLDGYGYVHPVWNIKTIANEKVLQHPAVASGKMKWTLIGCGDIYNQDREPVWCSWTQTDVSNYEFHILGDPDAKIDFTNIGDLAAFILKTIEHPELSENKELNFTSDHISYNEIAQLLEKILAEKGGDAYLPDGGDGSGFER